MSLPEILSAALSAGNVAALPLALVGGLVAGINPCCLVLYPAAAAACCGAQPQSKLQPARAAIVFVLGLAFASAALGTLAASVGRIVVMASPVKYAIALLPILMGVYMLGWVRLPMIAPRHFRPGLGGAFGAGLLLSLVIGPCGTPVLASVLSFAAYQQSLIYGGILLFLYGVGAGLPVVLVGTGAGTALNHLERSRFRHWTQPLVGAFLILLGFYLLWRI